MPIRFHCPLCNQLLGISRRKSGQVVNCPKCSQAVTVPHADDATAEETAQISQASLSGGGFSGLNLTLTGGSGGGAATGGAFESPDMEDTLAGIVVYDVQKSKNPVGGASNSESPISTATSNTLARGPIAERSQRENAFVTEVTDADYQMLLISRRTVYLQGILLGVVALVAFGLGFAVGGFRGGGKDSGVGGVANNAPVKVDIKMLYENEAGRKFPDEGAVAILLPAGRVPDEKLPIAAIRPREVPIAADDRTVQAIKTMGGVFAQANDNGEMFGLQTAHSGKFNILLLSRNAKREPGTSPKPGDLLVLARYFDSADELLGDAKYRLTTEELNATYTVEYTFAR